MSFAAFEPARQPCAAILDEEHLHAGMAAPIADQKRCKQVLDHLRCRGELMAHCRRDFPGRKIIKRAPPLPKPREQQA
jgi:hypothetical protein